MTTINWEFCIIIDRTSFELNIIVIYELRNETIKVPSIWDNWGVGKGIITDSYLVRPYL
jgi:hypothetical protein